MVAGYPGKKLEGTMNTKTKRPAKNMKNTSRRTTRKRSTVGASIVKGLEQAIAWTRGENENVRVTLVDVPEVDVREVLCAHLCPASCLARRLYVQ